MREGRASAPGASGSAAQPGPAARPARRRRWGLVWTVVALVVLLAAAGWALLASPLTDLQRVVVRGAERTGPAAVEQAAADQLGLPLLRVDAGGVADRVRTLPWVASVRVERDFPHGLDVVVVERVPVAAVAAPDGAAGVVLLDGQGRRITTARRPA